MTDARTNGMSDRDPLEAELESLRPADLPPALVNRIGADLSHGERMHRPRTGRLGAAAAAAACVALAAVVWRAARPAGVDVRPIVRASPVTPGSGAADSEQPALATYHRALADTPEALDALLDRHSARALPGGAKVTASSDFGILR
jgi:hypothetical protein